MQRLVKDAEALNTGFKAQRDEAGNLTLAFSDVVQAIELIQQKQGIAGTTAKEAATTIEGAFNMTKAAWENLIAGFANPDADMDQLMDNLIVAIVGDKKGEGLLNQLLPAIERALDGIGRFVEKAAPIIGQYLPGLMKKILPRLIKAATSLVSGVITALPTMMKIIIKQIPYIVTQIKDALIKAAPMIVEGGKELIKSIYAGIVEAFPQVQGVLDTLKNAFETAFNAVSGVINFVIENIDKFMPVLAAVGGALAALGIVGTISAIAGAITTVVGAIGTLISALSMIKSFAGLVSVITTLAGGPLVLIPVLIGAIVGAIIYLWNTSEEFRNFVTGLWETIKGIFMAAAEAVAGFVLGIDEAFTGLIETVSGAWETIKKAVDVGIKVIAALIKNALTILSVPWQFIWKNFGGIITKKWNEFKSTISNALNAIRDKIGSVWDTIKSKVESILNGIKTAISNAWEAVKNNPVLNAIKDKISSVWESIKTAISNAVESARQNVSDKFNAVKEAAGTIWENIKTTVHNAVDSIRDGISSRFESLKDTVSRIFETVKESITGPIENAWNVVSGIIESIKNAFDFKISFPSIELPHFRIDWEDLGGWFSIPHVSIDWYAKAYDNPWLFTEPTVLGGKGFGDRPGGEIVYGHESLMRDIEEAVKNAGSQNRTFAPVINVYGNGKSDQELAKYIMDVMERKYRDKESVFA